MAADHWEPKQIMLAVGLRQFSTTLTYYNNPTREHQKQRWLKKIAGTPFGMNAGNNAIDSALTNLSADELTALMRKIQTLLPVNGEEAMEANTERTA